MSCSRIWRSCARARDFRTGIDLDKLIACARILRSEMPNEPLYGGLARAGLPRGNGGQSCVRKKAA